MASSSSVIENEINGNAVIRSSIQVPANNYWGKTEGSLSVCIGANNAISCAGFNISSIDTVRTVGELVLNYTASTNSFEVIDGKYKMAIDTIYTDGNFSSVYARKVYSTDNDVVDTSKIQFIYFTIANGVVSVDSIDPYIENTFELVSNTPTMNVYIPFIPARCIQIS